MPTADDPRVTVRLPKKLYAHISAEAKKMDISVGEFIRRQLPDEYEYEDVEKAAEEPQVEATTPPSGPQTYKKVQGVTLDEPVEIQHPQLYRCPIPNCKVTMKSPAGLCPMHARKVVPL